MEARLDGLAENWGSLFLRGVVAIVFSIAAWARPGATLAMLIILLGVYAIADGCAALVGAARAGQRQQSWLLLAIEGSLGIVLGVFVLTMPAKALGIAFLLVALWVLSTGVVELIEAGRGGRHLRGQGLLVLGGLVRIAFGLILLVRPGRSALTLLWITAVYALVDGIVLIALSLRVRRYAASRRDVGPRSLSPQPT